MNLNHLKAFYILGRVKSYTRAAELLFVTQSAVSHAIKKLEQSLDAELVTREGKRIGLSPAGKTLFKSCDSIFHEIEEVTDELKGFQDKPVYRVVLGSQVEFGTTILLKHIRAFLEANPLIHLDFLFSHHLNRPLIEDRVDMIIDCKAHHHPDIEKIPLFRETYVTIASPEFVEQHGIRSLEDLSGVNILSIDKDLTWWHNFLISIPEKQHTHLKKVMQINHVRGIINGAMAGIGVGFVPKYTVLHELEQRQLIDPFPGIKPAADHFNIFIKKKKMKLPKNRQLIEYLCRVKPSEFGG